MNSRLPTKRNVACLLSQPPTRTGHLWQTEASGGETVCASSWPAFSRWIPSLFVAALLSAAPSAAQPWNKPPEQWTPDDVNRILTDSPWAPAKVEVRIWRKEIRKEYPSETPVERPLGKLDRTDWGIEWSRGHREGPSVLWWSARSVRIAQLRARQARNLAPRNAPLEAGHLEEIVIVVEGSEPLRILRDAAEDLRDTVYFELPSGMPLSASDIRFVEGERAGEDYVAFHFPREIHGEPTISANSPAVVFRCTATAKTELRGRPNALSIRVQFEPRRMRARGLPDF
jgi:hypothetical protein